MSEPTGKSFEQIMQDLNKMVGNLGKKSSGDKPSSSDPESNNRLQLVLLVLCVGVYAGISSFYKVEPSQQGVITRFGAYSGIAEEGPHLMLPFGIDQVYKIEVTRIHELQFGFRAESTLGEDRARQESLMLTGDLNVAKVEWILQYKIHDARKFLFHALNVEKNIRDSSIAVMRRVVGDKLVSDVLTAARVSIAQRAMALTQETIDHYDMGILITKVALQNVTPPEKVQPAFNEINIAKQEKEQLINQALGHYNKIMPEAQGKADRVLSEAEAYAVDVVNRSKGDAEKFRQMLVAYHKSPALTRKRMYLETMGEVMGRMEHFTIVDAKMKGILPVWGGGQDTTAAKAALMEKEGEDKSASSATISSPK